MKTRITFLMGLLCLGFAPAVTAQTYYLLYTDTVAVSDFATNFDGINAGDTLYFEFEMNNGGGSLLNQTWTPDDIVRLRLGTADSSFLIVFGPSTLEETTGNFVTGGSGTLIEVPSIWSDWADPSNPSLHNMNVISATDDLIPRYWTLNGDEQLYIDRNYESLVLTNAQTNAISAAYWSISTTSSFSAVPEPSTYAAILGGLALGFVVWRRQRIS